MIPTNIITKVTGNVYLKRGVQAVIVLILLWLLWNLSGLWLKPFIIKQLGGYTAKEMTETIDTLEVRRDTIWAPNKTVSSSVDNISKPTIVYNYNYYPDAKDSSSSTTKGEKSSANPLPLVVVDSVGIYDNAISDSLINGNIKTVLDLKNCKIIEQRLDYKPKFPIIVKEFVTIEKTKTETLFDKPKAKIGIGLSGTSKAGIGGVGVYQTPKNWQYQGGYLYETNSVLPNKGVITVSIIKLF